MKTLEEKIAVMQAALQGKRIERQVLDGNEYWCETSTVDSISWNWEVFDYRVSREPRSLFVNEYVSGLSRYGHTSKTAANLNAKPDVVRCVEFVEKIEP